MIIGLMGKGRSGKSTVGDIICKLRTHAQCIGLADPLKKFCQEVYDFTDEQLYGPSEERDRPDWRYDRGEDWTKRYIVCGESHVHTESCAQARHLTAREALQTLGTQWGRVRYQDTWVDLALRRADVLLSKEKIEGPISGGEAHSGNYYIDKCDLVVFTDVRFINEAQRIHERKDGFVWRILRMDSGLAGGAATHASEMEQEDEAIEAYVDRVIPNDGSLDELRVEVGRALSASQASLLSQASEAESRE